MKTIFKISLILITLLFASCEKQYEGPRGLVNIDLGTYALWSTSGVAGVGDSRYFNREKQIPANFPFTVNTYTGYGGVLLVMAYDGITNSYEPQAYGASCPVEGDLNVCVTVDPENIFEAYCPKCKSRYAIVNGLGGAISGVALDRKCKLPLYKVRSTGNGGYIITSR